MTARYTGLVNGDTAASLTTAPTLTTNATASSPVAVNPYAITASGAVDANYTISYAAGTLTVNPALVSVTAASGTAIYGNGPANPGLVATGLQNGEGVAVLTGLSSSFALTSRTGVGTYTLGVAGTDRDPNYTVTGTSDGSYTITPRPITITATDQTRLPGYANAPLAYQIGGLGLVNGDFLTGMLATSATATSPPGTYPIVQSTLAATQNYAVTFVPGTLVVSPALAVSATDLASTALRGFGQAIHDSSSLILLTEMGSLGALASPLVPETSGGLTYHLLCSKKACIVVPPNAKTAAHRRQKLSQLEPRVR